MKYDDALIGDVRTHLEQAFSASRFLHIDLQKHLERNIILSPRIQQMITLLLANQEIICQTDSGHITLHYHQNDLKAKIEHPLLLKR